MPRNNLGEKFFIKNKGLGRPIVDYNDFSKAKEGDYLGLFLDKDFSNEDTICTTTYFEKREIIDGKNQRIYLQHHPRTNDKLFPGKKRKVIEYILPLDGKIELSDFLEGQRKSYSVCKK